MAGRKQDTRNRKHNKHLNFVKMDAVESTINMTK